MSQRERSSSWFQNAVEKASSVRKMSFRGGSLRGSFSGESGKGSTRRDAEEPTDPALKPKKFKAKRMGDMLKVYVRFSESRVSVLDRETKEEYERYDYRKIKSFRAREFDNLFEFEYTYDERLILVSFETKFPTDMCDTALTFTNLVAKRSDYSSGSFRGSRRDCEPQEPKKETSSLPLQTSSFPSDQKEEVGIKEKFEKLTVGVNEKGSKGDGDSTPETWSEISLDTPKKSNKTFKQSLIDSQNDQSPAVEETKKETEAGLTEHHDDSSESSSRQKSKSSSSFKYLQAFREKSKSFSKPAMGFKSKSKSKSNSSAKGGADEEQYAGDTNEAQEVRGVDEIEEAGESIQLEVQERNTGVENLENMEKKYFSSDGDDTSDSDELSHEGDIFVPGDDSVVEQLMTQNLNDEKKDRDVLEPTTSENHDEDFVDLVIED